MSMITIHQVQTLIDEKAGFGQDEFSKAALALLDGDMCHLVSPKDIQLLVADYVNAHYQAEHGHEPTSIEEIHTIMRTTGSVLNSDKRYHLIDIVKMLDDPHVIQDLRGRVPGRSTKLRGYTMASIAAHYYTQNDPDLSIQGLHEKTTEAELTFTIRYESEPALLAKINVIINELQKRQSAQ